MEGPLLFFGTRQDVKNEAGEQLEGQENDHKGEEGDRQVQAASAEKFSHGAAGTFNQGGVLILQFCQFQLGQFQFIANTLFQILPGGQ